MGNLMHGNQPPKHPENSTDIHGQIDENKVYPQESSIISEDVALDQLLAENEYLRQELYYAQNNEMSRLVNALSRHKYTLSNFVRLIEGIHKLTTIKKQDLYGMIYSTLINGYGSYYIQTKDKKPSESKLRFFWRMGYLPHLMFIARGMYDALYQLKCLAPKEFQTLVSKLQSEKDKQKQKLKKGGIKKP